MKVINLADLNYAEYKVPHGHSGAMVVIANKLLEMKTGQV